jgi:Cytochrome P460
MNLRPYTLLLALSVGCDRASATSPPSPNTGALTSGTLPAGANDGDVVRLPVNFHDGYLANAMLVTKEPNNTGLKPGMHLIYVNQAGLDRFKQGGSMKYPDGTVLVDDVREFPLDDGVYHQGGHEFITTMVRDSKTYASTGGWGFQAWLGGDATKPIVTDSVKQCFACHMAQDANDYVFSKYLQ